MARTVSVLVPDADREETGETVAGLDGVPDDDGATLGEQFAVAALNTGATLYGAAVTPRNCVLVGADASTVLTSVAVLNEYSVVLEVAYSINTPHPSLRPAREMIVARDCRSMEEVGVCRVHVPLAAVYCAMLLLVVFAVSVIQSDVELAHTNPYGLNGYDDGTRDAPVPADVRSVVPVTNELRPPAG